MKKRIVSWLMTLVMVLGLLPTQVWAEMTYDTTEDTTLQSATLAADEGVAPLAVTASAPTIINSADDFAKMTATGNYKLGADIEVTKPYSSTFKGTFDGDGHTVTLNLNVTSGNAGLFGEISGATIKNVLVNADVTSSVSSYSSSYYATAGLIGTVSGASTVENCGVIGSVNNTSTSTVYMGGLLGRVTGKTTISNCFSAATVTSKGGTSSYLGGLIGMLSKGATIKNCYVTGEISINSSATRVGGLLAAYTTERVEVTNCYVAANVKASSGCYFAYNGSDWCKFTNCHYDSTLANGKKAYNKTSNTPTGKTTAELKALAGTLGTEFREDTTPNCNNGYPILGWQYFDPNASYEVKFAIKPVGATLLWNDTYTYQVTDDTAFSVGTLPVGEYNYTVSYNSEDYEQQSGKVTVKNGAVTKNVTLVPNEHKLTFTGLPKDAELTVKDGAGNTVSANSDGSYSVVNGTYNYTAKAFGYEDTTGSATIDRADKEETVTMALAAGARVTFENADKGTLTVKAQISYWETKVMTGTNGGYNLPFGYKYTWTFTSDNYIDQSGTYEAKSSETTATITIPLKAKPTKNDDGYYQIENADQLAWLAQQVNAATWQTKDNYNAVLTKDIDLGGKNWTPIGKSGYPYKGTFDGQGHTVSGLYISAATSDYQGLFGYVNGGTIQNLAVAGAVTGKFYVAGIVGNLGSGTVSRCVNKATVEGRNQTGGVIGRINGTGNVESCYNRGKVSSPTNSSAYVGGIVGQLDSSNANIEKCYSVAEITGISSNIHSIVGYKSSGNITDCYYLNTQKADANATAKTTAELKALAPTLGAAFLPDSKNVNDGYPVLVWQIPTSVITFTVNADAKVTIDGYAGTKGTGNTWTFNLPDGTYSYTVSAYGYEDTGSNVVVSGAAKTVDVSLTQKAVKAITFAVTPNDATVTVTWDNDGRVIAPNETGGKTYTLPYGEYQYSVWKQGYARVTKSLDVDGATAASVTVVLEESTAWDGASDISEPTQTEGVYQISSGSELAWFAAKVNGMTGSYKAVLCGDIELNGHAFTPIGTETKPFSGTFDGQGYTISGLNVSDVEYAGLFGVVKDATIKNVIVKGTVSGTSDAGGIVGYAKSGTVTIENCGNEAEVSGKNAGGIIGHTRTTATITGCYNAGAITGEKSGSYQGYAAGIAGCGDGSDPKFIIKQCYNTGKITSTDNAGGICAYNNSLSVSISECYNAGIIAGSSSGAIIPGDKHSLKKCFYLDTGVDSNTTATTATKLSTIKMQSALLTELGDTNWEIVRGVNGGMPVLQWQKVTAPTGEAKLSEFVMFTAEENAFSLSGDEIYLPTAELTWEKVNGAESYVISIYRVEQTWTPLTTEDKAAFDRATTAVAKLSYVDEDAVIAAMSAKDKAELAEIENALAKAQTNVGLTGNLEKELAEVSVATEARAQFIVNKVTTETMGSYATKLKCVADLYDVTGTKKDMADIFAAMDEGAYYVAVSAVVDGKVILPDAQPEVGEYYLSVAPYNRMKAVTGLKWEGTKATWDAKEGFTAEQLYRIDLYRTADEENSEPEFCKSVVVGGNYTAADMSNSFAAEKKYLFTVTAIANSGLSSRESLLSDSLPSGLSDPYDPNTVQPVDPDSGWIEISSAKQWVELANIKDVPSDPTNSDSPSEQQIAWSKNYRLTGDIDFSTLTAEEQMKTKSIGNVTNRFMGTFDGQGHHIKGLTLSNHDSGLFWYVGATGKIHDLTIENANVLFSDNAAVLVHNNFGTIENCAVLNTNITADTGAVLGGMVSRNYGIIRNSYVQGGTLTSNTTTATGHAGFAGSNEEGALIEKCWTSMTVNTQSDYAGGFVGLGYGGTIKDCFTLGDVTARGYSGGFVGRSVYSGNTYENCYAAGTVTVTSGVEGNGFIGGNKPDSAFQVEQSEGVNNCYYNSAVSGNAYGATAKSLTEMESAAFVGLLGSAWTRDDTKNNGLPYLTGVDAPESATSTEITVQIAIATYDKSSYSFKKMGGFITLTLNSNGNTRVVDVMDAAQAQGKLTYSYATTSTFGRFIHTINGRAVDEPDGWMFTINDTLSNVSASLATVKNGDKLLWFEGTTENHFQGPTWEELFNPTADWVYISTVEQLRELANAVSKEVLGKNYRLTADLDLKNVEFTGIGSAGAPFTGKFDGQYHTIKNVTIDKSNGTGVGFFNVIKGATITNLTLESVTVTGDTNVGGLVGHAQVQLDKNDLSKNIANLIGNCAVSGTVTGSVSVGGLVGWNDGTTDSDTGFSVASSINNSRADVTVTGTGSSTETNNKIGGLVGDNAGTITGSSATGAVSGENMVGGLAGNSTGSVYDSHAEGNVGGNEHVGGFVGFASGTIRSCYSLGDVRGNDYTGGFGGSISGTVDTAMSAGVVNGVTRMRSVGGYIGGFVGHLTGTLTGVDNQITVKNVYGYCGGSLPSVGNASAFSSPAQKAALEGMTLPTMPDVSTTIYDLFRVYLPVIQSGLDGFHDAVVPYGTAENTAITLGNVPEGMTVEYTVLTENDYVAAAADGKSLKIVKQNNVTAPVSIKVKVKLTGTDGAYGEKTVTVRLLPQYTELLHKLAQGYQNTTDEWAAMDMMAYGKLTTAQQYTLSATAKQNIINLLIGDVTKESATVSDYSRAEIVLRSLGIDSTKLHPANSEAVVSNAAMLQGMTGLTTEWVYGAPLWGMLAALQGNVKLTNAQVTAILGLVQENMGDSGLFAYTYQGVSYPSPDTAATALAALQPYVGTNNTARTLADTIYNGLKNYFAANGTFGNANSDAMVIIGLIAAGENPYEMKDGNGKTVVDALLSWVNDDADGFVFYGATDEMATEQGFRALVALEQFNTNGHKAYNVYDFSANRVVAGQATGTGTTGEPEEPEETDEITVSVTISAPNGTWLSKSVTVKKGSTVYHAFVKALEGSGISQSGAKSGYVRSMTKDGVKYGEFTHGENSGWLYMVNGMLPTVGLTSYRIADGDSIYWYYTVDWTKDPAASAILEEEVTAEDVIKLIDAIGTVTLDSGDAINAARMAYNKLSAEEKAKVTNYDVLLAAEAAYAELLLAEKEKETAATDWQTPYKKALDEAAKRELAFGDEWLAIALARSGKTVPEGYYDSILKAVQAAEGNLSDTKYTEYSRTILALTALGKNPADVGGYDLLSKLADMDKVTYQGINGAIFALIALDSGHYEVPAAPEGTTQTSREALVAYLLEAELPEGGWTLSGSTADVDITAMVLQALANYQSEEEVKNAVERGLNTLSTLQLADGGFGSWGTVNSESCAQVIIALTALGIDPATDSRFLKHGFSPLDALCAFYTEGGFRHSKDGAVDAMATEQALCALTAYYRFTNHLSALYDMADTAVDATPVQPTAPVEEEEGETSVVVWIAVGVAAVGAAGGLLAVRRRKRD